MGLDQCWLIENGSGGYVHFANHRKFNALEGFMADEWAREHEGVFNCRLLEITSGIVEKLQKKVKEDGLEPRPGYFFGSMAKDEWYRRDIRELMDTVLPQVKRFLEEDRKVFYSSWW